MGPAKKNFLAFISEKSLCKKAEDCLIKFKDKIDEVMGFSQDDYDRNFGEQNSRELLDAIVRNKNQARIVVNYLEDVRAGMLMPYQQVLDFGTV